MSFHSQVLAVVRVSPKGGHVKQVWIYEERPNGWILGGPERSFSGQHPIVSSWHAPQNIIARIPAGGPSSEFDWNGILPGTLVGIDGRVLGIALERQGAKYIIMPLGGGEPFPLDWQRVVPADVEDGTDATA
jgi:hypothetical protein